MKHFLLAVFALSVLAAPAFAEDDGDAGNQPPPAAAHGGAGPCKADAEKLCPGMHPGDGKFGDCMKQHKDEVSDACKEKMQAMHAKMQEKMGECKEQVAKACPDMKPGDGKWGSCMKEHKDDISPKCRRMMATMARRAGKNKKAQAEGEGQEGDDQKAPAKGGDDSKGGGDAKGGDDQGGGDN